MNELLKSLAEQTGLDLSTATNGLGAVIAFLKQHLPANLFGQLTDSLPDAEGVADSFETNKVEPKGAGSIVSTAAGLLGKLVGQGGEGAAQLVKMLESAGLNLSQITSFLPKAIEALEAHLPAELLEKIKGLVLGGSAATSSEA